MQVMAAGTSYEGARAKVRPGVADWGLDLLMEGVRRDLGKAVSTKLINFTYLAGEKKRTGRRDLTRDEKKLGLQKNMVIRTLRGERIARR